MRSPLLPIFLIVAVDVLALTIVIPLLPFYAEMYGASPFVVGCIVTSFAICQLISGPLLGKVSDRMGRKPVLLVSQCGTLIGFILLGAANHLWEIFLARIIDGITAGNLSIAQAYISDVTPPEDRAKSFGIIGISFGLGFLIGPAISGFLSQYAYHYPIYAAALLSLTSILATAVLLPKDSSIEKRLPSRSSTAWLGIFEWQEYRQFFQRVELAPILMQFFIFAVEFSLFISGFALFSERRFGFGPTEVGYVFAFIGFLGLVIQGGLIGRLVQRFGESQLALWGFITSSVGYLILGFSYGTVGLLVAATIASFGNALLRPCLTSLISRSALREEQGVVLGLTQSMTSIAQIGAPILAGLLIEYSLLTSWAALTALVTSLGFVIWVRQKRYARPSAEKIPCS